MERIEPKIKTYPASILRRKARPVAKVTQQEQDILSKMAQAMYESKGIGLAANQVGIDKAMLVADPGGCLYKLVNPKIVNRRGRSILEEGCLSVPEICLKIRRAASVVVKAQDANGRPITVEAEGLLSHILQHEIDHLRGRLIIDYASFITRMRFRKKLKELRRQDEKMCQSETKSCELQL